MPNIPTKCDKCYVEFVTEKPAVDTIVQCPKGHRTRVRAEERGIPKGNWPVRFATMQPEDECRYEDEPVCPYCGYRMEDAWELNLHDGQTTETDCGNCGNAIVVSANVSITYNTSPVGGWKKEKP